MAKKINKKKVAVGVGLGIAAAAGAVAAGYYFNGSKHAAGNRKRAAAWASDLKSDVVRKAKKLKKLDERAYQRVVDEAMKAYQNVRAIDKGDLASAALELKRNWKAIEREIGSVAKAANAERKVVRREVRKAMRKVKHVIPRIPVKKKKV